MRERGREREGEKTGKGETKSRTVRGRQNDIHVRGIILFKEGTGAVGSLQYSAVVTCCISPALCRHYYQSSLSALGV